MDLNTKIGVCSRSFSKNNYLRAELSKKFANVKFNDSDLSLSGDSLVEFLSDCDGAIIALEYINRDILPRLPKLKFIGKYGVGLDKIDLEALDEFGIKLGWTPGVNATSVAELTLNMALTLVRNTLESHNYANKLDWKQIKGKQLSSLTFGIVGLGHVGSIVSGLARAFGSKVVVYDKVDKNAECQKIGAQWVNFDELLGQADIVSIHVPGNKETYHMFDKSEFEKMKQGAYLINTARGGIVNEVELINALNNQKLAGAGFDVLEIEPPVNADFIHHPKTFVTTHIGGSSEEAILSMGLAAIDGLINFTVASEFGQYK